MLPSPVSQKLTPGMDLGPVVCLGGDPAGVCEQSALWPQSRQVHTVGWSRWVGRLSQALMHLLLPLPG